jgi:predicted CXXCH cytochrome family protein
LPATAAYTACHNSAAAKGHAALMTTDTEVETCVICHGTTSHFAVTKIHQ